MTETTKFDMLARVLFEGEVAAVDFKTMPGTDEDRSRECLSSALIESMERMGLIVDGKLTNKLQAHS